MTGFGFWTSARRRSGVAARVAVVIVVLLGGCGDSDGDATPTTAPESARVDRATPTFSKPTAITNPLFPAGTVAQAIQLGSEGDRRLRFEVTLLPETRTIEWDGKRIETVVSQFVGYSDGRIAEVARDFFAQADDGSVWYFGEDVANYEDGKLADTEGTWLAGKDGPPGMIMPAAPKVGDVYRPENIPDLVFEEVTVKATGQVVDGPRGPVAGAVLVQENLMDGTLEDKTFAPGYGEFSAKVESEDEEATVAVAVPTDAAPGAEPPSLAEITTVARGLDELTAANTDWTSHAASARHLTERWAGHLAGGTVPPLLRTQMERALGELQRAVDARRLADVHQAALAVGHAAMDLQLLHRAATEVDRQRFGQWARRLLVDVDAGHRGDVSGDSVVLDALWARAAPALAVPRQPIEKALTDLRAAVKAGDLRAAGTAGFALHAALPGRTS